MTPSPSDYTALLHETTTAFSAVLRDSDHAVPVPACPGWSLGDLGRHLESVHRWARVAVLEGRDDATIADDPGLQGAALPARYRETASALLAALEGAAPDAPCWTFGPPPHTAAFWRRRQAFETVIHLFDARSAAALPSPPIDAVLAADGVDEVARMFFPRQVRLGRIEALTCRLELKADDVPAGSWVLAGDGTGPSGRREPLLSPDIESGAVVAGTAWNLLLLLWKRVELGDALAAGRVRLDGDQRIASSVLQQRLAP